METQSSCATSALLTLPVYRFHRPLASWGDAVGPFPFVALPSLPSVETLYVSGEPWPLETSRPNEPSVTAHQLGS